MHTTTPSSLLHYTPSPLVSLLLCFFKMAVGRMEVDEKLPDGSDSILQSKGSLESMSRRELQELAKKCGITAYLSSAVIIEKILLQRPCVREHDILQQFKKDCEVLSSEHMAALNSVAVKAASAMGVIAGCSPDVAENAARSMAVRREFVEFVAKVRSDLVEAQRTMTKRYEAELSEVALGEAELQSEVAEAAAPKPPAVS